MNVLISFAELFNTSNLRWAALIAGTFVISGIAVGIGSDMARNVKGHVPPDPPVHVIRRPFDYEKDAA